MSPSPATRAVWFGSTPWHNVYCTKVHCHEQDVLFQANFIFIQTTALPRGVLRFEERTKNNEMCKHPRGSITHRVSLPRRFALTSLFCFVCLHCQRGLCISRHILFFCESGASGDGVGDARSIVVITAKKVPPYCKSILLFQCLRPRGVLQSLPSVFPAIVWRGMQDCSVLSSGR